MGRTTSDTQSPPPPQRFERITHSLSLASLYSGNLCNTHASPTRPLIYIERSERLDIGQRGIYVFTHTCERICLKRDSETNTVGKSKRASERAREREGGREGERERRKERGRGRRREGEVTNIWGSSGRATRALIELYKSLILHPHFPHPAPPTDRQPILERSPFRSLMLALFTREVLKYSRPLYPRSNGTLCNVKLEFALQCQLS